MALSGRLQFMYENLLPQQAVWDFCCDHGYLGIEVLRSEKFSAVYFVDQVPHIVQEVQTKVHRHWPELSQFAHFRIGKAETLQEPIQGNAVIAGVGAYTIFKIVESLWQRNLLQAQRLILCPQRDEQKLLQLLESLEPSFQKKFVLKAEHILMERGRQRFVYVYDFRL